MVAADANRRERRILALPIMHVWDVYVRTAWQDGKVATALGGCPSLGGDRRVERSGVVDYLNILSPLGVSTWCNRREGRELRETRISCRDATND